MSACMLMAVRIQIAKFKLCQYQLRAYSSNLMLAKVTHYIADIESTIANLVCCWCAIMRVVNCAGANSLLFSVPSILVDVC